MAKTLFGSPEPPRATLRRRNVLLPVVVGLSLTFAGTTFVAAETFTVVNHFSTVQHFDPSSECGDFGGSTDSATGTEHFHITDLGDSVAVSYSETFWITTVPDRPTEATYEQQGTDALTFHLLKDGSQIFHESFHQNGATFDNGATYLMIRFYTTFVYVNGTVLVDHTFDANPPSC
jgi:hypothetical protein